jgi:hypothetical protein
MLKKLPSRQNNWLNFEGNFPVVPSRTMVVHLRSKR